MVLPAVLLALTLGAAYAKYRHDKEVPSKGSFTPARQVIFETAMNDVKEPAKLRALAKAFREQGLYEQADLLEKRAMFTELPPDVQNARKDAFRKGMNSQDPVAVDNLADAFYKEGAIGAASTLHGHAAALRATYGANAPHEAAIEMDSPPTGSAAAPIPAN